ncbi:MAG: NUDIX hydrolase [Sediminibacterium sp.]|nr:NUDIX hydrolase [Sediminibacterium sp.]
MVEHNNPLCWSVVSSHYEYENKIFKVRNDLCLNQNQIPLPPYFVLEMNDWVIAIAITKDGKYILEEAYRHGNQQIYFEFPAGTIDNKTDSPLDTIKRELLEETGFEFEQIKYLGKFSCNPALINNQTHIFIAEEGSYKQEPALEAGESFNLKFVSLVELKEIVNAERMIQAQHIAAYYMYLSCL